MRTDPPYVRIGTRTCEYASSSVLPSWSSFLARPPSHVSCPLASSPSPLSPLAQSQPSRPLLLFPLSSFPFLRFRRVLLAHLPFPAAAHVLPSPATPPRSSRPGRLLRPPVRRLSRRVARWCGALRPSLRQWWGGLRQCGVQTASGCRAKKLPMQVLLWLLF